MRALLWYLDAVRNLRPPGEEALFLTRAPHRRTSPSTISRRIVEVIWLLLGLFLGQGRLAGALSGPGTPRAHDVRAVAASWALFEGVPLDGILSSAVRKNPNSFISCYLTDVVRDEGRFGRAALRVGFSGGRVLFS